jgi:hypothetical protein
MYQSPVTVYIETNQVDDPFNKPIQIRPVPINDRLPIPETGAVFTKVDLIVVSQQAMD